MTEKYQIRRMTFEQFIDMLEKDREYLNQFIEEYSSNTGDHTYIKLLDYRDLDVIYGDGVQAVFTPECHPTITLWNKESFISQIAEGGILLALYRALKDWEVYHWDRRFISNGVDVIVALMEPREVKND